MNEEKRELFYRILQDNKFKHTGYLGTNNHKLMELVTNQITDERTDNIKEVLQTLIDTIDEYEIVIKI